MKQIKVFKFTILTVSELQNEVFDPFEVDFLQGVR